MYLNRSTKDSNFIKPFFLYLNLFLITPWYDFNRNLFRHSTLSRIYGCVLICMKLFWMFSTLMDNIVRQVFAESLFSVKIVLTLGVLTLLMRTVLIVLKSTVWNVSHWKTLFVNFETIDANLENTNTNDSKNFWIHLSIRHVLFGIFAGHQFYTWARFFDFSWLQTTWIVPTLEFYEEFLVVQLIDALVQSIRARYRALNSRLIEVCQNSETNKMDQELANLSHLYRLLGENVDTFNSIFGYQILLTLFHWGLQMILCFNYLFTVVIGVSGDLYRSFVVCNIFTLLFIKVTKILFFFLVCVSTP